MGLNFFVDYKIISRIFFKKKSWLLPSGQTVIIAIEIAIMEIVYITNIQINF